MTIIFFYISRRSGIENFLWKPFNVWWRVKNAIRNISRPTFSLFSQEKKKFSGADRKLDSKWQLLLHLAQHLKKRKIGLSRSAAVDATLFVFDSIPSISINQTFSKWKIKLEGVFFRLELFWLLDRFTCWSLPLDFQSWFNLVESSGVWSKVAESLQWMSGSKTRRRQKAKSSWVRIHVLARIFFLLNLC